MTDSQKNLVLDNMKLVYYVLSHRKFKIYKYDYEDYIQTGYLALCKAAISFDCDGSYKFSTYAIQAIKNELTRYREKNQLIRRKKGFYSCYIKNLDDELNDDAIKKKCELMNLSLQEYLMFMPMQSLNSILSHSDDNEDFTVESLLYDKDANNFIYEFEKDFNIEDILTEIKEYLESSITAKTSERNLEIFIDKLRCYANNKPFNLSEVSRKYGVSRAAIYKSFSLYSRKLSNFDNDKLNKIRSKLLDSLDNPNKLFESDGGSSYAKFLQV